MNVFDNLAPNRDQLRTDLRVEKNLDILDSRAVVKLLLSDRKLAFTSMSGSDWHTSKQKVYNWPSNKSGLRPHHDKLASSRPSHAIRKSIGISSDPRTTTTARPLVTDLRLTCDALRPISDRPMAWAQPPRVTCVTRQKFAWDKNFNLRPIYDRAEWHMRPSSELRPTCDPRRIQLRVGSLASEMDKFHDRFWRLKAFMELVDFNGE